MKSILLRLAGIAAIAVAATSSFAAASCVKVGATACVDSANPRIIGGVAVSRPCWEYSETYTCIDPITPELNYCAPVAATAGCNLKGTLCAATGWNGTCLTDESTYGCAAALAPTPPNVTTLPSDLAITSDTADRSLCAPFEVPSCIKVGDTCNDPPGTQTRNIGGLDVTKTCWNWTETYDCVSPSSANYCAAIATTPGCVESTAPTCTLMGPTGTCLEYTRKYTCDGSVTGTPAGATATGTGYSFTGFVKNEASCNALATNADCGLKLSDVCIDGPSTKVINGVSVTSDCWKWDRVYACPSPDMTSNCSIFDPRPECTFSSESCTAFLSDGTTCSIKEKTYNCSPGPSKTETITQCSDQKFCVDGLCIDTAHPADADFNKAMVMQEVARQSTTSPDFFKGEAQGCKVKLNGVGGLGNCCFSKGGGTGFTNATLAERFGMPVYIKAGVVAAEYVYQWGSNYVYEFFGAGGEAWMSEYAGQLAVGGEAASTTVGTTEFFGATFTTTTTEVMVMTEAGPVTEAVTTTEFAGFDPYTIAAMVAIHMAMEYLACEDSEQKLAMQRGVGICHYVGKWCDKKYPLSNACMTYKQGWCCFASKLARIVHEQVRPQLGRGWGTPQAPDCSSLTQAEIMAIDWSKVDLSEFVNDIVSNASTRNPDIAKANLAVPTSCEWKEISVAESACPGGAPGTIKQQQLFETCTNERKWVVLSSTCGCAPSWSATGATKILPCADGWVGEIRQEEQANSCDGSKRWAETLNSCTCVNAWTPTGATQTSACSTGFVGQITQSEQINACNAKTQWIEAANTCVCVNAPIDTGYTRSLQCPTGFSGLIREKEVKNYCDNTVSWTETARDCTCIDDFVATGFKTPTSCPTGFIGTASIDEFQNYCSNARENRTDFSACVCVNNWLDTGTSKVEACGIGYTGLRSLKEQKNFCDNKTQFVETGNTCQCVDASVPTGVTRDIACPTGFSGVVTQAEQINTCQNVRQWNDVSQTCACINEFVFTGNVEGPTSCGLGFTGTVTRKERKNFCTGATEWVETANSCACIDAFVDTGSVTDPMACGIGYTGTKTQKLQRNFCSGVEQWVDATNSCMCINGYVDTGTLGPILDCGVGFAGQKQDKLQQNFCNPADTRWVPHSNTCSCINDYFPTGTTSTASCGLGFAGAITNSEQKNACTNEVMWLQTASTCACINGWVDTGAVIAGPSCGLGYAGATTLKEQKNFCTGLTQWVEATNTCTCVDTWTDLGTTRPGPSCGPGFTGAIVEKEQKNFCSSATRWVQSSNTCACIDGWVDTGATLSGPCSPGFSGLITSKQQQNYCSGLTQWVETSNTCTCTPGSLGYSYGVPSSLQCEPAHYTIGDVIRTPKTDLCTGTVSYDDDLSQCKCWVCDPVAPPPECLVPPVTAGSRTTISGGGGTGTTTVSYAMAWEPNVGHVGNFNIPDIGRISRARISYLYGDDVCSFALNGKIIGTIGGGVTEWSVGTTVTGANFGNCVGGFPRTNRLKRHSDGACVWRSGSVGAAAPYFDVTSWLIPGSNTIQTANNNGGGGISECRMNIEIDYGDCGPKCKPVRYDTCEAYMGIGPRMPTGCTDTNCVGSVVGGYTVVP
jgi:conjugal transfer mating pair stabilization protein TraN